MGRKRMIGAVVALCVVAISLSAGLGTAKAQPKTAKLDKVTLQLKWVTQSQFAGYYAAKALGYYKAFGLDVTLKVGGPSITPEQVVASGGAQIGIDWLPSLLATRDTGTNLVNIAQMFARSGMTEIAKKTTGITSIAAMREQDGRRVVLREPVRALCRADEARHGSRAQQGRQDLQPALRHDRVPAGEDPGRRGDDVQRARAGARVEESDDREALHAEAT